MAPEIRTAAPAHATGGVIFVPLDEIADDASFRLRASGDVSVLAASIGRLGQLQPVELRPLAGGPEGVSRWQLVAGFRRLEALRLLQRDRVLARVHQALSDEDAWAVALVQGLTGEPLAEAELLALRERIRGGELAAWAAELVEEARLRAPLPPEVRERFHEFLEGPLPPARDEEEGEEQAGIVTATRSAASTGTATSTATGTATSIAAQTQTGEEVEEVSAEDFAQDLALRMAGLNQDLATAYGAWKDLPDDGRRLLLVQARYVAELLPYLEDAER